MTSLKRVLRGFGMSQFSDREFYGYAIALRPNDWLRSWFRILGLNLDLMPYFSGCDIYFNFIIAPTKRAIPSPSIKYTWQLYKKGGNNQADANGSGSISNLTIKHKKKLFIGHFSYTDEYRLELEVELGGEKEDQTVADFEITSRAGALMNGWLLVIGGLVGYLLGRITSGG
ncbi:MAG TPA: hypothetical protein VGA85_03675 [Dehalococcoidales bacterium]